MAFHRLSTGLFFAFMLLAAASSFSAQETNAQVDPLTTRWTFGNHEPIPMFERIGTRSTGGIDGGALWLEEWHHWFDSEECPALMESLGLNMLHCRFFKGMGWEFESRDFPNVKRFVENCHKHHVRALAYVQFSTLYYEIMLDEIPDLESWVCLDENGKKRIYGSNYFRWIPCETQPAFEAYLKKMITIALTEGGFDGIMIDNAYAQPCYCPRCRELFRKYLTETIPDPMARMGIPGFRHVEIPVRTPAYGEIQDPLYQEWLNFRCQFHSKLFSRLAEHAQKVKPGAVFTANIYDIRRNNLAGRESYDVPEITRPFSMILSQSGNAPRVQDGAVINRVREIRMAQALGKPILALCDQDAGLTDEEQYLLPLLEDAVFGGIPTDRTVLRPDRSNLYSKEVVEFRRPLLARFNQMLVTHRESFAAPAWQPVRVLRSRESILFSEAAHNALLAAEEILLRNHVPYGLLLTCEAKPLEIPEDCELLLVCHQTCLSDQEIDVLIRFAQRGGKLIVTGTVGDYDSRYRQRRVNRLSREIAGLPNVLCCESVDQTPPRMSAKGWNEWKASDGGKRLADEIAKLWKAPVELTLPETVLTEWKRAGNSLFIHLVNYSKEPVRDGLCPTGGVTFQTLLDDGQPVSVSDGKIPAFRDHALLKRNEP